MNKYIFFIIKTYSIFNFFLCGIFVRKFDDGSFIVINLFGPPGSGKSTGAAEVFAALKKLGVNAELVTEFAKDKTWEHNATALGCQEYVFGKQSYRLARCRNDVDVIVTDNPLPLSLLYNQDANLGEDFNKVH